MRKRICGAALCLFLALALTAGTSRGSSPCKEGCSKALGSVTDGGTVKLMRDFYVSPQTGVPMIPKSITLTSADPESPCRLTTAMSPHPTLLGIFADIRLQDIIIDGGSDADDGGLAANGPLVLVQQGNLTLGHNGPSAGGGAGHRRGQGRRHP